MVMMSSDAPVGVMAGDRLLTGVRITGFRTLREASFRPGHVSALVGEPGTGKSNLLAAIRTALDPEAAPPAPRDVARATAPPIKIEVETVGGASCTLEADPPTMSRGAHGDLPPVLYLPAHLRSTRIVESHASAAPEAEAASRLFREAVRRDGAPDQDLEYPPGTAEAAHGLIAALEAWQRVELAGLVVLIEEPELYLPPQSQRYLYRLVRGLGEAGNQILYSTHSPSFLNVARLHELVLTEHDPPVGTRLFQPEPLPTDSEFRAYSEFDATRSELFMGRAAILVEGQTERLALPFVFRTLGYDPDRERISIIECGGKPNIPLIAQVAKAVGVPFVAVHDRDAPSGGRPIQAEQRLNRLIGEIAGPNRVELTPDFEGVAGLRGRKNKPARAWNSFSSLRPEEVPAPLARIVHMAVAQART